MILLDGDESVWDRVPGTEGPGNPWSANSVAFAVTHALAATAHAMDAAHWGAGANADFTSYVLATTWSCGADFARLAQNRFPSLLDIGLPVKPARASPAAAATAFATAVPLSGALEAFVSAVKARVDSSLPGPPPKAARCVALLGRSAGVSLGDAEQAVRALATLKDLLSRGALASASLDVILLPRTPSYSGAVPGGSEAVLDDDQKACAALMEIVERYASEAPFRLRYVRARGCSGLASCIAHGFLDHARVR